MDSMVEEVASAEEDLAEVDLEVDLVEDLVAEDSVAIVSIDDFARSIELSMQSNCLHFLSDGRGGFGRGFGGYGGYGMK